MSKLGIKEVDLARSVGVDTAHISRIFSGKRRPSVGLALAISKHLGISVEELCSRVGIEPGVLRQRRPRNS